MRERERERERDWRIKLILLIIHTERNWYAPSSPSFYYIKIHFFSLVDIKIIIFSFLIYELINNTCLRKERNRYRINLLLLTFSKLPTFVNSQHACVHREKLLYLRWLRTFLSLSLIKIRFFFLVNIKIIIFFVLIYEIINNTCVRIEKNRSGINLLLVSCQLLWIYNLLLLTKSNYFWSVKVSDCLLFSFFWFLNLLLVSKSEWLLTFFLLGTYKK